MTYDCTPLVRLIATRRTPITACRVGSVRALAKLRRQNLAGLLNNMLGARAALPVFQPVLFGSVSFLLVGLGGGWCWGFWWR